jgi:hypothetical protein
MAEINQAQRCCDAESMAMTVTVCFCTAFAYLVRYFVTASISTGGINLRARSVTFAAFWPAVLIGISSTTIGDHHAGTAIKASLYLIGTPRSASPAAGITAARRTNRQGWGDQAATV